jgi:hypothetical protein
MAVNSSKSRKVAAKRNISSKHSKRYSSYTSGNEVLSWRNNPETSFSDWTLEIAHTSESGEEIVDVYHVHKCMLAVGPRHSDYFAALFQKQMQENQTNTSRIELEESQAKLFPCLLDYIYGYPDSESELTLEEYFQLLLLAEYFQALGLHDRIVPSMCECLTMTNVSYFLAEVKQLNTYRPLVLEEASKKLANIFEQMTEEVAAALEPEFFLIAYKCYVKEVSVAENLVINEHMLVMMASCFENHVEDLLSAPEIFNELVYEYISDFDSYEILALCRLMAVECKLIPPGTAEPTSFQDWFIKVIEDEHSGLFDTCFQDREHFVEVSRKLSPLVLSHLFASRCF